MFCFLVIVDFANREFYFPNNNKFQKKLILPSHFSLSVLSLYIPTVVKKETNHGHPFLNKIIILISLKMD